VKVATPLTAATEVCVTDTPPVVIDTVTGQ